DSFGLENVGFIKIDTEGSEISVLEGAKQTVLRWRPHLMIELLVSWHEAQVRIEEVCGLFDYAAFVSVDGHWVDALAGIRQNRDALRSNNVLFRSKVVHG